jgi:hypothetical protein
VYAVGSLKIGEPKFAIPCNVGVSILLRRNRITCQRDGDNISETISVIKTYFNGCRCEIAWNGGHKHFNGCVIQDISNEFLEL